MARYFFHSTDSDEHQDDKGLELVDVAAARATAVSFAGEMLKDLAGKDHHELRVRVHDALDKPLFEVVASIQALPTYGDA